MRAFNRVLALGAHTDDIELGCGGYLSRLRREGSEIMAVAFSRAEESLGADMAADTLEVEFRKSMALLGIREHIYMGSIPVRHFPAHRQEVLEDLVTINRDFKPDLVLTMNSQDTHQDHSVIHAESLRAFRGITMLGYELPWNQQVSRNDLFVELQTEDVETKIAMLAQYASQSTLNRSYVDPGYVNSSTVFRGYQGRVPLAEMYEVISMIWGEV